MTAPIDHRWSNHASIRLSEAAYAAAGVRIAVETNGAHIWTDVQYKLDQAIEDLLLVRAILAARIADEPKMVNPR